MTKMTVFLSNQKAPAVWGESALLSFNGDSITIHYKESSKLQDVQKAGRRLESMQIFNLSLSGECWDLESNWHFWLGFYHPKTKNKANITWSALNENDEKELKTRLHIIDWTREVINEPAEDQSPIELASKCAKFIADLSPFVSYKLITGDDLKEQGFTGIYTVGKGSDRKPALLELDYNPTNTNEVPTACLVGKGITFDSGGYSLKPTQSMETMRADMGGAGLVTGAFALAISKGLKKRVKLYVCCADNLVSGSAFKLGDIIRYRNGVSVEVKNTDAEGRLVLADGLICAESDKAKYIIDCATLTGAAKVAVGNDYQSLLSFDDELASKLLQSAQLEYENFWRLPLSHIHRSQFPSSFADISNSGIANTAGASTAAAFLSYFLKNYEKNWLHIDCSATFRKGANAMWSVGSTGTGVRTLSNLLLNLE